jgi:hypothetical protein
VMIRCKPTDVAVVYFNIQASALVDEEVIEGFAFKISHMCVVP